MSKPRSRLIGKADHEFRTVKGFTTVLHFGRQAKHLRGQPNYDASKSTITLSIQELQRLVELKAGTGTWRQANREVVDFEVAIGLFRDLGTGEPVLDVVQRCHHDRAGVWADQRARRSGGMGGAGAGLAGGVHQHEVDSGVDVSQ